jgi:PAS domain S-box-containing protein
MKTILIVDDIRVNLKVLEVLLTRHGYAVLSAGDVKTALGLLQGNPCDLIISDIHMPEMDGFQFCRLCKLDEMFRHIPFIFYSSSHTGTRTRQQARKVGAHALVKKPADPARLLKTIDAILSEAPFQSMTSHWDVRSVSGRPCKKDRHLYLPARDRDPADEKRFDCRLLENLPAIVWTLDASGRFKYISPAVERLTGFSTTRVQKIGKKGWLNRIHPADAGQVRIAFKQLFKNHVALDIEYRFECRNRRFIWLQEKSGTPYKDETSGQYQVDGIVTDISGRMLDQDRRLKSREQEVVNTFSKGVSHDMDNLLTGMADYLHLSAMSTTSPRERHRFLANAMKISRSALALNRDIRFLSNDGKTVEKNSLFTRVVARVVRSLLEGSDIEYRVEIPRWIWPCRVDTRLMAQALEHIIFNAFESMARKSDGAIEVVLENLSIDNEPDETQTDLEIDPVPQLNLGPGSYVKATIQDNGCGIDGQLLHQIFHPYFSSKPRDMKKGVGLGLALTRVIIARHGGEMAVFSKKHFGTKIEIFLPAETGI